MSLDTEFESPDYLIAQTRRAMKRLENEFSAYFTNGPRLDAPFKWVEDPDPFTGHKTIKLVATKQPSQDMRHIAGTALNDLRHALDQATATAYRMLTGKDAPRDLYFPIGGDPSDLEAKICKHIPVEIQGAFRTLAAYPGGSAVYVALNKATRENKHLVTCRIGGDMPTSSVDHFSFSNCVEASLPPVWDWDKGEMILGVFQHDAKVELTGMKAFPVLVFAEAGPLSFLPIISVVLDIAKHCELAVEHIKAATAEAVAARH